MSNFWIDWFKPFKTNHSSGGSAIKVVADISSSSVSIGDATAANQVITNSEIGATNESAAATDTSTSGLNGLLKRIAQRITSLIALIPTIWNSGTSQFRSLTVNSTAQAVKASSGNLYGWNIINRDAVAIYVKIYNIAAASVNPASSVPVRTLQVSANGSIVELNTVPWNVNSTAISVRAVTEATDTGTTAPATLPIIELLYS